MTGIDRLQHLVIYKLFAFYHLVGPDSLQFLLACNQLQHTVHDVVSWELVQSCLAMPTFHSIHGEASPPVVVLFQHVAHEIEPVGAPPQLIYLDE